MDRVVVVTADPAAELRRLVDRDGFSEEEARGRMASQMPLAEKAKVADYVIDNSGSRAETERRVREVYRALLDELKATLAPAHEPAPQRPRDRESSCHARPDPGARQHFLRDRGVAQRIVELVAPTLHDLVVEIGPGRGALTEHLAPSCRRLLALEVDTGLAAR